MRKLVDVLSYVVFGVAVVVFGYAMLRSNGPVTSRYRRWQAGRASEAIRAANWDAWTGRNQRSEGRPGAVVIVTDYECPWCRRLEAALDTIERSGVIVPISYVYFLNPSHPLALPAAIAARCAQEQGHFLEAHRLLFTDASLGTPERLGEFASKVPGLDTTTFVSCRSRPGLTDSLRSEYGQLSAMGINATPALVSRRAVEIGYVPANTLSAWLRENVRDEPTNK